MIKSENHFRPNLANNKKVIIFDLGGVIFKFNHMIICKRLSKASGISPKDVYKIIFNNGVEKDYDEGKITSKNFYKTINNILKTNLSFAKFNNIWSDIFKENIKVSNLIRKLKDTNYKLYLLSNTNEMHFNFLKNNFEIINSFDGYILSYKIGYRKPSIEIYNAVLRKTGLAACNHIYIDDLENFVNIAKSLGMIGIVFKSFIELKRELFNNNILVEY